MIIRSERMPSLQFRRDAVDLRRADVEMRGHPHPALSRRGDDSKILQSPHDQMAVGSGMPDADNTGARLGSALAQDLITLGGGPLGEEVAQCQNRWRHILDAHLQYEFQCCP